MKAPAAPSDDMLIAELKNGVKSAFGQLYTRYSKLVFHRCLSICKDRDLAFDLSQEVMLKAWENIHQFRGDSHFSTWLYVIATRHTLLYLSINKRFEMDSSGVPDEAMVTSDQMDAEETNRIMLTLIHRLPEQERQLLLLKYQQGESIETLERTFNLSASAIKMRLKRSRERLNALYSLALTYGLDQVLNIFEVM